MKKKIPNKDRVITWIYFVILIFLILFLFFNKYGLLKYLELRSEISTIEQEIERSESQIKDYDSTIQTLKNDDKALEKVAREKFLMKKKNEKVFRFEDKKDTL